MHSHYPALAHLHVYVATPRVIYSSEVQAGAEFCSSSLYKDVYIPECTSKPTVGPTSRAYVRIVKFLWLEARSIGLDLPVYK